VSHNSLVSHRMSHAISRLSNYHQQYRQPVQSQAVYNIHAIWPLCQYPVSASVIVVVLCS